MTSLERVRVGTALAKLSVLRQELIAATDRTAWLSSLLSSVTAIEERLEDLLASPQIGPEQSCRACDDRRMSELYEEYQTEREADRLAALEADMGTPATDNEYRDHLDLVAPLAIDLTV